MKMKRFKTGKSSGTKLALLSIPFKGQTLVWGSRRVTCGCVTPSSVSVGPAGDSRHEARGRPSVPLPGGSDIEEREGELDRSPFPALVTFSPVQHSRSH